MSLVTVVFLVHSIIVCIHGDLLQPMSLRAGFQDTAEEKLKIDAQKNAAQYLVDKMVKHYPGSQWTSVLLGKDTNSDDIPNLGTLQITAKCASDLIVVQQALQQGEKFAQRLEDAAGKPPSGTLDGNLAWLGSYDECRSVTAVTNTTSFIGEYCLGTVKLQTASPVGFHYGICLPDSCNDGDAEQVLKLVLKQQFKMTVNLTALCSHPPPYMAGDYVALVICSVLVLLVLIGTVLDAVNMYCKTDNHSSKNPHNKGYESVNNIISGEFSERAGLLSGSSLAGSYEAAVNDLGINVTTAGGSETVIEKIFLSFSIISNGKKLFNTHTSSGNLTALNGMRVLSMWWVIQGHTFGFSELFLDNLAIYPDLIARFLFQAVINASFSVDTFFFLSGLLVAYLTLNAMTENQGKVNWAKFVFHRFWRLTPALAFCVMIFSTLYGHIMEGPFARTLSEMEMVAVCKTKWWPNLLYINNFYPSYGDLGAQCVSWTWYLANDMQFYLISPFLLCLLYRWRWVGLGTMTFLITTCLIVTGVVARIYQMCANGCPITHHTTDIYAQHDIIYNKPFTRIAPYLVGMLSGYFLSVTKCRLRINKYLVGLGWLLAAAINLSVLYGLYGLYHGEVFSPDVHALYIGTSRFAWSIGLAWVAIACATGNGGPVNDILSWRVWAPLGRLTYCAYLFHPMVIMFYYVNKRKTVHYSDVEMSTIFLGILSLSYAVAFIVSMVIEAPLLSLEKIMFKKK